MDKQGLIFDGFMRLEIYNNLSKHDQLIPRDITQLCMQFFQIDIKSLLKLETNAISSLTKTFIENKEYFMALNVSQILLNAHPEQAAAHELHGRSLYLCDLINEAEKSFQQGIELDPQDISCRYYYGVALYAKKKYELALTQYKKCIEINNYIDIFMQKCAACYEQMKDFENAEKYYKQAIDMEPDDHYCRYKYGALLQKYGKHKEALTQFTKAMELDKDDPDYIMECAYSYYKLDDVENADKYYLKAIEMDGGNKAIYSTWYALFLWDGVDDLENAKKYYMKAMEIEPNDYYAYYAYAEMLRDYVKDYDEAEEYYLKALKIDDKGDGLCSGYGYLLYLMFDYGNGMKYVKRELEVYDNNLWAHFHHGLLNKVIGNDEMMEKAFMKAVELVTDKEGVIKRLEEKKTLDILNVECYEKLEKMIMDLCV